MPPPLATYPIPTLWHPKEVEGTAEEGWVPRIKWPPPDLVVVDEMCKKVGMRWQ